VNALLPLDCASFLVIVRDFDKMAAFIKYSSKKVKQKSLVHLRLTLSESGFSPNQKRPLILFPYPEGKGDE